MWGILGVIRSRSLGSESCVWIWRWEVHCCVQRLKVSLDGICPVSPVASVSGLILCTELESQTHEGLHHIVHFCSRYIYSFCEGYFLWGLCWCWGLFARDCRNVHHDWHLWESTSSCDWVRRDSQCHACSFQIPRGERISRRTFAKGMLSDFILFGCKWVS